MAPSAGGYANRAEMTGNGVSQSQRPTSGLASRAATGVTASSRGGAGGGSRPVGTSQPSLRNTASTSSLRAKAAAIVSNGAVSSVGSAQQPKQQQQQSQSQHQQHQGQLSLLSQLPLPDFSAASSSSASSTSAAQPTTESVQARLLQIAESYMGSSTSGRAMQSGDIRSACFYARLAFNCNRSNISARRLLAATLLSGAQTFPLGQRRNISTLCAANTSLIPQSTATRAGAHAVIELLGSGPQEILADIGCARLYAAACVVLGRSKKAEEILAHSQNEQGRWASGENTREEKVSLPPWSTSSDAHQCTLLTERSLLSARGNRYDEAQTTLRSARQLDPWNWSAWAALCDIQTSTGDTVKDQFGGSSMNHEARQFYAHHLQQLLLSNGHDDDVVRRVISALSSKGDEYFTFISPVVRESSTWQGAPSSSDTGERPPQARSEEMTRTASKRTSAQAITPSSTTSSLTRPGSRNEVTTAAKRMRTMASATGTQRTAPVTGVTERRTATSGPTRLGMNQGPSGALPSAKGVSAPLAKSASATGSVRMTGTLSASRTNEQARPLSAASTSSRGTNSGTDEAMKPSPRRSARTNIIGQVENVTTVADLNASQMRPPPRTANILANRRTATTRPGGRAPVAGLDEGKETTVSSPKAFSSIVQKAALDAVNEAKLWNAVDEYIRLLTCTIAEAYRAVRNGHGRMALALLRAEGPLTSSEAEQLRKEATLIGKSPEGKEDVPLQADRIEVYNGLSEKQRNCPEIQCLIARAQHDQGRYHLAEKHFMHARRLSPSWLAHMDIYSLTLFHLQREVQLSELSAELASIDRLSVITHIASGNAFALQGEHGLALQSFQRACLIAPDYAYAFTLAGYEACETGQRDKSVQYFREAIKIEQGHWNAFAGLGQVYLQEDKLQASAYYYHHALDLHRTNPVLWDVFGRVKLAQGKLSEAERAFGFALRLDERSAMSHIKMAELLLRRASVERQALVAATYRQQSHQHLLNAVKIVPDEAHVHLMLAKSYMDLGEGSFATLLHNNRSQLNAEGGDASHGPQEVEVADLATLYAGHGHVLAHQQQQVRAIGKASLPVRYRAEIAQHLSTAVDLNPRLARFVKAMGEGARAALRGAAARLTGGSAGFAGEGSTILNASLLPDELTAMTMTTDGVVDSMLEIEGDHVLVDEESDETEIREDNAHEETAEEVNAFEETTEPEGSLFHHPDGDGEASSQDASYDRQPRRQGGAIPTSRYQLGLGLRHTDSDDHQTPNHSHEEAGGVSTDAEGQDVSMSF